MESSVRSVIRCISRCVCALIVLGGIFPSGVFIVDVLIPFCKLGTLFWARSIPRLVRWVAELLC